MPQPPILVAIGANTGPVVETLQHAAQLAVETPGWTLVAQSPLYTTAPMGSLAGGQFINGVWHLATSDEPLAILRRLQHIEDQLGRVRSIHWGPRAIDLDLIACGSTCLHLPDLQLPHPGAWYRRFVLDPLVDVAPNWEHPVWGGTAQELRRRWEPRPVRIGHWHLEDAWDSLTIAELLAETLNTFPQIRFERLRDPADRYGVACVLLPEGEANSLGTQPPLTPELRLPRERPREFLHAVLTAALDIPHHFT